MTKTKSTKRALVSSALALMMCISMLIGSTFAWFTDSVTSSSNKIQSGTLKLDLEMLVKNDDNTTSWKSIKEDKTALFNYANWEPGYTDVKVLKVENEGSLALKWVAKFVAEKELSALANVIDVYVCPSETEIGFPADRTLAGYTRVGTVAEFVNTIEETTKGTLEADQEAYLGIALKMQETAGNEYQGLDLGGAFDIQILATQYTFEKDSFDNQYDKDAEFLVPVKSAKELTNALADGKDVKLTEDITFTDAVEIPENTEALIDLQGNNFAVAGEGTTGSGFNVSGENTTLNIVNSSEESVELVLDDMSIIMCDNGGTINIENVDIKIDNAMQHMYAGVAPLTVMNGSTLNMYDGNIISSPLAVMIDSSTFNMYGGKISVSESGNNPAMAITASASTINLYGGKISVESTKTESVGVVMQDASMFGSSDSGSKLYVSENFIFELSETSLAYKVWPGSTNCTIVDERNK